MLLLLQLIVMNPSLLLDYSIVMCLIVYNDMVTLCFPALLLEIPLFIGVLYNLIISLTDLPFKYLVCFHDNLCKVFQDDLLPGITLTLFE